MIQTTQSKILFILLLSTSFFYPCIQAQISLSGQLFTRTELRAGLGNLVLKGAKSAAFTSQRTRLILGYKWDRLKFGASIQDVRVWGQDASSLSNADGNRLMLHEGWADLILFNKADTSIKAKGIDLMSIKIGRQELNYDDVRLIGNLDWLQQGRRHDLVLLKIVHQGWQIDIGQAFNQNSDAFGMTSTAYVPGNLPLYIKNSNGVLVPTPAGILPLSTGGNLNNNSSRSGTPVFSNPPTTNGGNQDYKSFTSLYISKKFNQTKFSALFFNDHFGKYTLDSIGSTASGYVYGRRFTPSGLSDAPVYSGTNSRFTYGLMINHSAGNASGFGKISVQTAYYIQSGSNRDGIKMKNSYHFTAAATYQKGKFSITPGYDILSGNNASTPEDEKFDPMYGTPHKHWGCMDYFYVGTGSPSGGLSNPYLKLKYTTGVIGAGVDWHFFSLNQDMKKSDGSILDKVLGNEVDLQFTYTMNKFTNIELAYSLMNATSSMAIAKGQASSDAIADTYQRTGTWFYAMIRFTPDFLSFKSNLK
ncbi:MAG: alginate export family protein [Saprospiraceae bacterium]